MYDEASTSAWFREQAEQADAEFRAQRGSAGADAVLARSCVFGYLYDRYFLETRELLLNELRWMQRNDKPKPPGHAASAAEFEAARNALLDELIARYSGEASAGS